MLKKQASIEPSNIISRNVKRMLNGGPMYTCSKSKTPSPRFLAREIKLLRQIVTNQTAVSMESLDGGESRWRAKVLRRKPDSIWSRAERRQPLATLDATFIILPQTVCTLSVMLPARPWMKKQISPDPLLHPSIRPSNSYTHLITSHTPPNLRINEIALLRTISLGLLAVILGIFIASALALTIAR